MPGLFFDGGIIRQQREGVLGGREVAHEEKNEESTRGEDKKKGPLADRELGPRGGRCVRIVVGGSGRTTTSEWCATRTKSERVKE